MIAGLSGDGTRNLCEKCHAALGCGGVHGTNLYDDGVCDHCGQPNEVVNCSIANYVVALGISDLGYWRSGLPRIWQKGRRYGLVM